jgi:hypothetical protein
MSVLLFTLILMVITTLPYIIAVATQGDRWTFNGFLLGVEDGNAYLGKMRLGARGFWQFFLFYSPENHDPEGLLYLPYIMVGQFIRLFIGDHDPKLFSALILAYHCLRLVFNSLLIIVIYRFIAAFLKKPTLRFLAFVFAILGGGLGWLILVIAQGEWLGSLPPEFYIPEGFSFSLILLGLPHIALGRAALLGGFLALFKALSLNNTSDNLRRWLQWATLAGGCWLIVGLTVSFYFAILYCLMGAWGITLWLTRRQFPLQFSIRAGVAVGITLPLFLYYFFVFTQNDAFAEWSSQNQLASPHLLHYVFSYSILGFFATIGVRWTLRNKVDDERFLLLVGWVLIVPILVYLPINVQRRMAEAVIVPLAILATIGIRLSVTAISRWRHISMQSAWKRLRVTAIVLLTFSSILMLLGQYFTVLNRDRPLYRPNDELYAMDWLNEYAPENDVVMGTMSTGNLLPARTNLRVFLGHGPETLKSTPKKDDVVHFFTDQVALEALENRYNIQIDYVFYGPLERDLTDAIKVEPDWQEMTRLIYDHNGYQIYEVIR